MNADTIKNRILWVEGQIKWLQNRLDKDLPCDLVVRPYLLALLEDDKKELDNLAEQLNNLTQPQPR